MFIFDGKKTNTLKHKATKIMRKLRFYTLLYYILYAISVLVAQPVSFSKYMAADGLSDNNVLCGLRDSYGFMWLGTNNGLNCFDGTQNIVFRNMVEANASFENNTITALYEYNKDIWFGGSFGLYVYHRESNTFTRFDKKTKYGVTISATVQDIVGGQNGYIWIGTLGQGLFLYDPATDVLTQDSRHGAFISDILTLEDSPVFVTTLNGSIQLYSQNGDYMLEHPITGYKSDKNNICLELINHRIYIGCEQGLYTVTQGENEVAKIPEVNLGIHSMKKRGNELLLGTDHGIYTYNPVSHHISRFDNPNDMIGGLSDTKVNKLMWDKDSTLWVMTQMGGVNYLTVNQTGIKYIELPEGNKKTMINAICESAQGHLWLGTSEGLFLFNPTTNELTKQHVNGINTEISSLMLDGDDLWIGTGHDGIYVLNTTNGSIHHYKYSAEQSYTIPSNDITSMLRSSNGEIYVGTGWGLCRFDRKNESFLWYFGISAQTYITSMCEDKNGFIWVATRNHGIFTFNKWESGSIFHNYIYQYDQPQSLASNDISTVFCDAKGTVWIAYDGLGISRYNSDNDGFESFGTNIPELQEQQIYFIEEDLNHQLWIGMETGFLKIPADRNTDNIERLSSFDKTLRQLKPYNSQCVARNGLFYIGAYNHFLQFNPPHLTISQHKRPVYITALTLPYNPNNKDAKGKSTSYHPWPYTDGSITLPYADNSFTLHFAQPNFTGYNASQHFEYKMEGLDATWARGTKKPEATFNNLAPGTYTFLLREAGNNNEDDYAQLRITVLPPWYRSTLAYLIYALIGIALIFYAERNYTNKLRRRYNRKMKEYQTAQEKANFESKIRFFIDLVHEIRTPLSLISLPLEQIEGSELSSENKRHTNAIRRNMNYLLGITNQLLDFQKAENGHIQINSRRCDVGKLLNDIYQQFTDSMELQGKQIQLQLPDQPVITALDVDKIQKVMMNIIGNATKYAKSEIIIRLEQTSNDRLCISVIDDGPGVPNNERDKIFDVYYQIGKDDVAATLGTGLGLSYAKMLAKAHEGDLVLSDSVGGGANFQLVLPIVETTSDTQELKEVAEIKDTDQQEEPKTEGANETRTFRVLLVEDNEELLQMTTDALRPYFRILKAHDGMEALDVLNYNDVDVIVSDVMMPRMDGIELCQRIKEDINYSHIPIILLTAKTSIEAKLEGMQSGADIYLEKPFSAKQLHLQIMNLLRMRQQFYERMRNINNAGDATTTEGELGMNQQDLQFMERLQQMVAENMRDEEFSIDILAEQMNMSRSSFYRKIKALTDMTPIEYLKMRRLEQAAQLLRQGVRITEVAERVGFTSSSYFAKCFKSRFGVLPKEYIQ